MKEMYLDLMCKVIDVYTEQRIRNYIDITKVSGITEHGFPRLCANIGILIAHGRMTERKTVFEEMMEICCRDIPAFYPKKGKRGNDFSVREIVSCILELEASSLYPVETIARWKDALRHFEPQDHYRMIASYPPAPVNNWAAFNASSEQIRCFAGLAYNNDFIENQIASQMFSFDENGMYRDPNDPMMYDLVTRNMLSACLHYGYCGSHKDRLEENLRKGALLSLYFQSVTGELPYGGRSNQFIHNEAHIAVSAEYEASHYNSIGDKETAGKFKASAELAVDRIRRSLGDFPDRHIKNLYPIDSSIGCENYAYYDKYMVTVASFLYLAYQFCDDSIIPSACPATEEGSYTRRTSDAFRKVFCKNGPYFLEAEWSADPHYDAIGIGRIHRRGAPSAICLSVPAHLSPNYKLTAPNPLPLSICCGAKGNSGWEYCSENGGSFRPVEVHDPNISNFTLLGSTASGKALTMNINVTHKGIGIRLNGEGLIGVLLPAFWFDGDEYTAIDAADKEICINYHNWNCRLTSDGNIQNLNCICSNRNGEYKMFRAEAIDELYINIQINK